MRTPEEVLRERVRISVLTLKRWLDLERERLAYAPELQMFIGGLHPMWLSESLLGSTLRMGVVNDL